MENFVVSALKYRPQTFDTVVGQSHITITLKNAIKNNQLAHAFLFCGPRGVGKTTCARILAKTINCENRSPEGEACNQCDSCRSFNAGQSFNIHELDAASNNSVDDIRELVNQVRFAPQAGKYKVYIIDEVHMLSAAAFNAFLKTLEEPPSYAVFILATTEKHKIIPTILSRCQIFDFKRITIHDTVDHLKEITQKENIQADPDALHLIAQKTEGCMRDALSTLDKIASFSNGDLTYHNTLEHLNILDYDYYFRMMDAIQHQDAGTALLLFDEILKKGFESDHFLEGLASFLRDLLVCRDKQVIQLLETSANLKKRYEKVAAETETGFLVSALNLLNESAIQYKQARNTRLLVEMCLIRLCYLQQAVRLITDEKTGSVSKKKVADPFSAPQMLRPPLPRAVLLIQSEEKIVNADKKTEITEEAKSAAPAEKSPRISTEEEKIKKIKPATSTRRQSGENIFKTSGKLDLKNIQQAVEAQDEHKNEPVRESRPLEEEEVLRLWAEAIAALKEEQKVQIATNLELSIVSVPSSAEVLISCRSELQKNFVDDEKLAFAETLKKNFNNPHILITVKVDDSLRNRDDGPEILTQRQQLERMLQKYPLLKELKDKLNLDLG